MLEGMDSTTSAGTTRGCGNAGGDEAGDGTGEGFAHEGPALPTRRRCTRWPGNKIPRLASLRSELRVGKGGSNVPDTRIAGWVQRPSETSACITASERPHWEE